MSCKDDEQQNLETMNDKMAEINLNLNDEKYKDKCNCTEGCSERSCSCFKYGSVCNSSCGCGTSCQNMFNHLDYFFGENTKYGASPCFAKWLMKNAKNADELKLIDRNALRRRIKRSPK